MSIFNKHNLDHQIGIELNDRIVRFAVIRRSGQQNVLKSYGASALPDEAIVNGLIIKPELVAQKLKAALSSAVGAKISTRYVTASIPEPHVFTTVFNSPTTDQASLSEAVQWEALQHIPFSRDEVQFDWSPIEQAPESLVLVGAVPKNVVSGLIKVFHLAGLVPLNLQAESAAVIRSIIAADDLKKTQLLIDLGANRTTVIITRDGTVYFSSTTAEFTGRRLTERVADKLKLSDNRAEKAKRLFGLNPRLGKGEVRRALLPAFTALVQRLMHIEHFVVEHLPKSVSKITGLTLTGGGSELPGLSDALAHETRLPVSRPLPSETLAFKASDIIPDPTAQLSLATAFGLALNKK